MEERIQDFRDTCIETVNHPYNPTQVLAEVYAAIPNLDTMTRAATSKQQMLSTVRSNRNAAYDAVMANLAPNERDVYRAYNDEERVRLATTFVQQGVQPPAQAAAAEYLAWSKLETFVPQLESQRFMEKVYDAAGSLKRKVVNSLFNQGSHAEGLQ
jgi:hypothetical protein